MKRVLSMILAAAMLLCLTACGGKEEKPTEMSAPETAQAPAETATPTTEQTAAPTTEETVTPTTEATVPPTTAETVPPTTEAQNLVNGMRPEFVEAMDSYEEFFDEYVAIMEKYSEDEGDVSMLLEYGQFLWKYAEFAADFEAW